MEASGALACTSLAPSWTDGKRGVPVAEPQTRNLALTLDEDELAHLLMSLERTLCDTLGNKRRSQAAAYQFRMRHREAVLRRLIDRLRGL